MQKFEKFTCAYLFQIALEIIRLPIQFRGVWIADETLSRMLDISSKSKQTYG